MISFLQKRSSERGRREVDVVRPSFFSGPRWKIIWPSRCPGPTLVCKTGVKGMKAGNLPASPHFWGLQKLRQIGLWLHLCVAAYMSHGLCPTHLCFLIRTISLDEGPPLSRNLISLVTFQIKSHSQLQVDVNLGGPYPTQCGVGLGVSAEADTFPGSFSSSAGEQAEPRGWEHLRLSFLFVDSPPATEVQVFWRLECGLRGPG